MWQQSTCLSPGKPVLVQFAQREASSTGAGDGGGKNADLGTSEEIQRSWCFLLKGFFLFKAPFFGGKNYKKNHKFQLPRLITVGYVLSYFLVILTILTIDFLEQSRQFDRNQLVLLKIGAMPKP
jgi:hypothetical protein